MAGSRRAVDRVCLALTRPAVSQDDFHICERQTN